MIPEHQSIKEEVNVQLAVRAAMARLLDKQYWQVSLAMVRSYSTCIFQDRLNNKIQEWVSLRFQFHKIDSCTLIAEQNTTDSLVIIHLQRIDNYPIFPSPEIKTTNHSRGNGGDKLSERDSDFGQWFFTKDSAVPINLLKSSVFSKNCRLSSSQALVTSRILRRVTLNSDIASSICILRCVLSGEALLWIADGTTGKNMSGFLKRQNGKPGHSLQ